MINEKEKEQEVKEVNIKKEPLDITIIIPVHVLDNTIGYLERAIASVHSQKVEIEEILIVAPTSVANDEVLKTLLTHKIKLIINPGETDFCSQVNYGVSQINTKYFSVLELDDEYSNIFFKNAEDYINAYPNVSGFLPTLVLVNKDNVALQFVNEAVWAQGFSEQLGYLDMASLLQYDNFMISGGIFTKESFEEVGGLKSDIKLYFNYEFLLRYVNSDFSTMVIPRLGYKHLVDRDGSLFKNYTDPITGIKHEEARFYLGAAKKEYFFNPNIITRTIKYSPTAV